MPEHLEAGPAVSPGARLQLRWAVASDEMKERFGEDAWVCHYELVLPLGFGDIRADGERNLRVRDELVLQLLEPQVRIPLEGAVPCEGADGSRWYDPAVQADAHAIRDCDAMQKIRIVAIAPDGTLIERPAR